MKTSKAEFHSYNVEIARKYGIYEAVIIAHMQHWINHNMRMGYNNHDGRTWTHQTRKEIAAWFPEMTEKQVRTAINNLVKLGVLIKGNYNKKKFDKTNWYAFKNQEMFTMAQMGHGAAQMGQPIPDTKPDTKPTTQPYTPDGLGRHTTHPNNESHDTYAEPNGRKAPPVGAVPPAAVDGWCDESAPSAKKQCPPGFEDFPDDLRPSIDQSRNSRQFLTNLVLRNTAFNRSAAKRISDLFHPLIISAAYEEIKKKLDRNERIDNPIALFTSMMYDIADQCIEYYEMKLTKEAIFEKLTKKIKRIKSDSITI